MISELHFDCRHLVFLEPEVTVFGRKGGSKLTSSIYNSHECMISMGLLIVGRLVGDLSITR